MSFFALAKQGGRAREAWRFCAWRTASAPSIWKKLPEPKPLRLARRLQEMLHGRVSPADAPGPRGPSGHRLAFGRLCLVACLADRIAAHRIVASDGASARVPGR